MSDNQQGVRVSNVNLVNHGSYKELSADVDGDPVWVRVPQDFPLVQRGEIFVAAALLEAMIRNEPLIIDDSAPISEKLLGNLTELQSIYSCWNTDLSIIKIYANTDIVRQESRGVASFYSGGIDSSQTLVTHLDEITHLVYIRGFGEFLQDEEWNTSVNKNEMFAKSIGKSLLPIDSNIWKYFQKREISIYFFHGLILLGLAGTLGFKKHLIPSSHTYAELFPWGSHPVTDHLWSTDQTEIIHDSAQYRRTEKTEIVASAPKIMDNLQVCWKSNTHNCGVCSKCVRTRLTFDLLGVATDTIPGISGNKPLKILTPDDEGLLTVVEDLMLLAKSKNADATYRILKKGWRKYQRRVVLTQVDRAFLGGILRRIRHLKPTIWRTMRVLLTSKERLDF